MSMPAVAQVSFYDPAFLCPRVLEPGSLVWLLATRPVVVFPASLRVAWERAGLPGRDPWPFRVVAGVTLLRFSEEGMSRRGAARRLVTDGSWRAATGLSWQDHTPDESELRRFERFLKGLDEGTGVRRLFLWLGHVVDVCRQNGVLGARSVWVADSTPMYCYGAILDTVRFLGDEARSLAVSWARVTGTTTDDLAREWGLPLLTALSTKGHLVDIDWSASDSRAVGVTVVAETAVKVAHEIRQALDQVSSPGKRKRMARRCRNLLRKVQEDLEADDQGRLTVARRVVEGRLVSRTDPEARHARKSRKKTFNGFKLHVLGDAVSGLIASVCVTPANIHDGAVAHRLMSRAKELCDDIEQVLGDTHYGSVRLRKVVRDTLGVNLVGKPQAAARKKSDRFRKEDFSIDFEQMSATCPSGAVTKEWVWSWSSQDNVHSPRFKWRPGQCSSCPVRSRCLSTGRRQRALVLHSQEEELRDQRRRWQEPETRRAYRRRAEGERLIHTMTRHGCRKARAWGLQAAQVQAHVVAITANLKLLATVLAQAHQV